MELEPMIVIKGIKKYFTGTKALDWNKDDTMEVFPGEIHGLVGENGAGKSTLVQVLMGIHKRTAGEIYLNNELFESHNALEAEKYGVSIIMQQPNILPNLTVAENIFIGRDSEFRNSAGLLLWKKQNQKAAELLLRLGFNDIKPNEILSNLSYENSKKVEIARALSINPKVLLVDETSAAVSMESAQKLYELLIEQKKQGVAIIYISHFIDEVYKLCDRITVLRDGKYIKTMEVADTTPELIISNMVGRDVTQSSYRKDNSMCSSNIPVFEIKGLSKGDIFKDISITINKGEIVGIAGIGGCGSEELGKALFGKIKVDSGELIIRARKININSPVKALNKGIGYIPKDRDRDGLILKFDVKENISSANLKNLHTKGFMKFKKEKEQAKEAVKLLKIKTPSINTQVLNLSGGNRQKVAIAKWITNKSDFLIINSPTRGVDVGAKYEIYNLLEGLRKEGIAILLISDDLPELIGMSDRILTMKQGRITKEFIRTDHPSEEELMTCMA